MIAVMTLNLNLYGEKYGRWSERRELVRQTIGEHQPDIVAVQAVRAEPHVAGGLDQASQLAQSLPDYKYVFFQPAGQPYDGVLEGSAFLARIPIHDATSLPLSRLPNVEDQTGRVLLVARVQPAGQPFYLLNGYFSWVPEQAEHNAREMLAFAEAFQGPALLVGDFNNTPDSEAMRAVRRAGWTDAWDKLRPGETGYTFESGAPRLRIDYVYANRSMAERLAAINIVGDVQAASGARPSDHLGLTVTCNWP